MSSRVYTLVSEYTRVYFCISKSIHAFTLLPLFFFQRIQQASSLAQRRTQTDQIYDTSCFVCKGPRYLQCLAPSKLPPSRQPGSGAEAAPSCRGPACWRGSSSEVAGFLSHVHTDRPLGRPRGPLLQQHVGLLVVQRRRPATALLDLVVQVVQLLPQPLTI